MYVRIFEDEMRAEDDNPTIGLVLCSEKNEAVAKYSVLSENKQILHLNINYIYQARRNLKESCLKI